MGKKAKGKPGQKSGKKERRQEAWALGTADALASPTPDALAVMPASSIAPVGRSWPPPRVSGTELAARLANLSTVLQRQLAHGGGDDGLTRARLSALALLVLGGPRTLGALAAAERVRPPTMTRLIHAMEADGLVAREAHPSDGRSIIIRATEHGQRQLGQGRARQIAPLADSITELSQAEQAQLAEASDLLGRVLREATWESSEPAE